MKLQKLSLLTAVVGALVLSAAFVPMANAGPGLQVYFNFNTDLDGAAPPYTSIAVGTYGGTFPLQQTTLFNENPLLTGFPAGQIAIEGGEGTTLNQFSGDLSGAGNALILGGNANQDRPYCFDIGSFSTQGLQSVSLSFAIEVDSGSFTRLTLAYGTDGTTWTNFDNIDLSLISDDIYHLITSNLPNDNTVNDQSTFYLQFCFSGSHDASGDVNIDNIQINAIPEPSTYIGGLLGIIGLCWYQRRWFTRLLGLRAA
jgi:hypothetical protein